jgi:hypothetical protein
MFNKQAEMNNYGILVYLPTQIFSPLLVGLKKMLGFFACQFPPLTMLLQLYRIE